VWARGGLPGYRPTVGEAEALVEMVKEERAAKAM